MVSICFRSFIIKELPLTVISVIASATPNAGVISTAPEIGTAFILIFLSLKYFFVIFGKEVAIFLSFSSSIEVIEDSLGTATAKLQ